MRKKFAALLMSVLLALTGCSGGSIYSNYRDIAQLLVVRTMGFDSSDSGGETTDASRLLHAAVENLSLSGRARVYTAAQIISALDRNGAALICAVRTVPAASSSSEAEPEETAIEPDGYIIIYKGKAAGEIPEPIAPGVGILKGETGTLAVSLGNATAELDRVSRELEPVTDAEGLAGLNVKIRLKASLAEAEGEFSVPELESRLAQLVKGWVGGVLECALDSGCDALHLAAELPRELQHDFDERMGQLHYNVEVTAELQRSYHLDLREERQ